MPTPIRIHALVVAALFAAACGGDAPPPAADSVTAPDTFHVRFETSRGPFTVQVVRAWAPLGADRFHALVSEGFFDEGRFFRVVPGFVAQFGANGDPKRNKARDERFIPDDPVVQSNVRGTLTFAHGGKDTRSHQLFVNLKDNNRLDADGFAPIGRVTDGMAAVDSLYNGYGETPKYHLLATLGNNYLQRMFPKMDHIRTARVVPTPP
jgi:cyclophilin family peptidyl-prolyl cis-trans isomerase